MAAVSIDSAGFRQFFGNAESVSWSMITGIDGYILATSPPEPPDTSVVYDGYEEYLIDAAGTIPSATFLSGDNRILGYHLIYAAAYTGAPTDFSNLPFDIPIVNNPSDNISLSNLKGRVAGMVISAPDSIFVSTE
jgi:hypothetical protein